MTDFDRYVLVDVETSGADPAADRILSIAALTITPNGAIGRTLHTLLNPGVEPGPTHIHGITAPMLAGQPRYAQIAPTLAELLRGRTLVAHNAAFDYAFLSAEARRSHTRLPVDSVLCTLELAKQLRLGLASHSLAALARHWDIAQHAPHDALDDALVLAAVFGRMRTRAGQLGVMLPRRSPRTLAPPTFRPASSMGPNSGRTTDAEALTRTTDR